MSLLFKPVLSFRLTNWLLKYDTNVTVKLFCIYKLDNCVLTFSYVVQSSYHLVMNLNKADILDRDYE